MSSRIETMLEALLSGSSDVPAPQSRVEALVYELIKNGGGGGGGAPADWSAAEGAAGHIKNRTHYSEPKTVVFLDETTVAFEGGEGVVTGAAALSMGATYTVTWNGTDYLCSPFSFEGIPAIGNTLHTWGNDSGQPFIIAYMEGVLAVFPMDETISSATIKIIECVERVTPLPEKFLPESVRPVVLQLTYEEWNNGKITQSFDGFAPALWSGVPVWLSYTQTAGATARMLVATFVWTGSGFTLSGIVSGAGKYFEATTGTWAPTGV